MLVDSWSEATEFMAHQKVKTVSFDFRPPLETATVCCTETPCFFFPLEPFLILQQKKQMAHVSPGVDEIGVDFCRSFC